MIPKDFSFRGFCWGRCYWKLVEEKWIFSSVCWRLVKRVWVIGIILELKHVVVKLQNFGRVVLVHGSLNGLHVYSPSGLNPRKWWFLELHGSLGLPSHSTPIICNVFRTHLILLRKVSRFQWFPLLLECQVDLILYLLRIRIIVVFYPLHFIHAWYLIHFLY